MEYSNGLGDFWPSLIKLSFSTPNVPTRQQNPPTDDQSLPDYTILHLITQTIEKLTDTTLIMNFVAHVAFASSFSYSQKLSAHPA